MIKLAAVLALLGALEDTGWNQWLGAKRDGRSPDTGLLKQWPSGGPALAWKKTGLGAGFSSVSFAGERFFTLGDVDGAATLFAMDVKDAKTLWTAKIGSAGGKRNAGPRSTPATDGTLVFVLGQAGELVCVAAADGKGVWRKSLEKDFGGGRPNWWWSESPLLDGEQIVVTPGGAGGAVTALAKADGKVLWRSTGLGDAAQYSSLAPSDFGGTRHYVVFTGENVAGIAAKDGKLLWKTRREGKTAMCSAPLVKDDLVFVSSAYGVGHNAFQVKAEAGAYKVEEIHAGSHFENHHGGMILLGDHVYGLGKNSLICMELKTGKIAWENPCVGKGSIAYADGGLVLRSEKGAGTTALVEATPAGYKEKGRFDPPDRSKEPSWAYPVIFGGRLYLRDQDVLLAYDVKAK